MVKISLTTQGNGKPFPAEPLALNMIKEIMHNNHKTLHKNMEPEDFIITKVGWITQMKSTPPLTEEYIQRVYLRFEIMIRFLQNHKFTTRIILNDGDSVNDETGIKHSDLTAEGRKFYSFGIVPWIRKIDRSRNPEKAIRDISFLEKKYYITYLYNLSCHWSQ